MTKRLDRSNLQVAETLVDFIEKEALPNTNINAEHFWNKFEAILNKFAPQNKKLLQIRSDMKNQIDEFYKKHSGKTINQDEYIGFLKEINYIFLSVMILKLKRKMLILNLQLKLALN